MFKIFGFVLLIIFGIIFVHSKDNAIIIEKLLNQTNINEPLTNITSPFNIYEPVFKPEDFCDFCRLILKRFRQLITEDRENFKNVNFDNLGP